MSDADLATLLAFFKAMANESRLRIVGLLAERERSVQELATLLELKEPTVSHHLAALKALGLVSARAEGVTRWHTLRIETLTVLNRGLLDQKGAVTLAGDTAQRLTLDSGFRSFNEVLADLGLGGDQLLLAHCAPFAARRR